MNENTRALVTVMGLLLAFVLFILYGARLASTRKPLYYFSGQITMGNAGRCGLNRILKRDWRSCEMQPETCSQFQNLEFRRVNVSATPVNCLEYYEMRCDRVGEYMRGDFNPTECYVDVKLVKIFPEEKDR